MEDFMKLLQDEKLGVIWPLEELRGQTKDFCMTLWARINLANWVLREHEHHIHYDGFTRVKIRRFVDQHRDLALGHATHYESLGVSDFPDDLSHCTRVRIAEKTLKPPPVPTPRDPGVLAREIRGWTDDDLWDTFGVGQFVLPYHPLESLMTDVTVIREHSVYCACVFLIHADPERTPDYVDVFYHCLSRGRMDDAFLLEHKSSADHSLWQLYYPVDTRSFTGDDLPNYFHLLWHLPLWGEADAPDIPMAKIMLKCMPFACQRRQLLDQIQEMCADNPLDALSRQRRYCRNEAFWRVFSKIMWCCLAGTYPNTTEKPGMRKLLRVKQLCDNRTLLMDTLTREGAVKRAREMTDAARRRQELARIKKEKEDNCLIIFTAFRLYILHMVHYNPHYAAVAHTAINWDAFESETIHMGDLIRGSNLFAEDAFAEARTLLTRANKLEKRNVYRFRKTSCVATILSESNRVLEKIIHNSAEPFKREIFELQRICEHPDLTLEEQMDVIRSFPAFYDYFDGVPRDTEHIGTRAREVLSFWQTLYHSLETFVDEGIKERILNLMIKVPRHQRLTPLVLSVLRDPRYGGVQTETVIILSDLIKLYNENALPKTMRQRFDSIPVADVRIVAWFFGVCTSLEKISFAPLDYDTVQAIGDAMINVRYPMFPGQLLNPSVYDVLYTLCCENVVTMLGRNCFGHRDVAFDARNQVIVCNKHGDDLKAEVGFGSLAEKPTRPQDSKSGFHGYSCTNQPVLTIPLRNQMLVIGGKPKNRKRYMRCPRCAGLHIFDPMRYRAGTYCCPACAKDDLTRPESGAVTMVYQCAFCGVGGNMGHIHGQTSRPRVRPEDVLLVMDLPETKTTLDLDTTFQYMRFCHRCFKLARRYNYTLPKAQLWKKIENKISEQLRNAARGVYK
jgi:hypothetical protein